MNDMLTRQMMVASVVLMLSAVAICQCVSGEKEPVRSRTRQIVDPNGKGVSGADVIVYDASRHVLFRTQSDAHGKFSVPSLPRDDQWLNDKDFHVEVSASGFIRYNYILLRSSDSRKVLKLHLFLTSAALCNDLKIISE
ncbi:MAG: carboxypeptidase-like regulatory domain-containing protein [Terriglobales bacterium]|jgi:hypothetical protein